MSSNDIFLKNISQVSNFKMSIMTKKKRLKSPLSYLNIPIPVFYFDVEIRYFFVHVPFTLTILSWHSYFTTLSTAHPPLLLVVSVRHTQLWCYCLSKIAKLVCYFITIKIEIIFDSGSLNF